MMRKVLTLTFILVLLVLGQGRPALAENPPYATMLPLIVRQPGVVATRHGPDINVTMGVVQDPFDANTLFAYTWGSGVYKSIDSGQSWFPSSTGIAYPVLHTMAADPVNPGVLYAGTYAEMGGTYFGVYKSVDFGATWAPTGEMGNIWNGAYYKNPVVYAIDIDPVNPQRIYAGTRMRGLPDGQLGGGGVFRSENGGATWVPVNNGLPYDKLYAYDLEINPAAPNMLYVTLHGANPGGVWVSTDYGNSWKQMYGAPDALDGRALLVDPFNSNLLYYGAATYGGFRRYSNAVWQRTGGNWIVNIGAISADPYHPGRVFAGVCDKIPDDVYCIQHLARSADYGLTWELADTGTVINEMAFSPDRQTAFLSYSDLGGVYKSTDGGASWTNSSSGLAGYSVTGVLVEPGNPNTMIAALYSKGVKLTTDGGGSWTDITPVINDERMTNVVGLAMHRDDPQKLYAITDQSGVFATDNRGIDWYDVNGGYPAALASPAAAEALSFSLYTNRPIPALEQELSVSLAGSADELIQPAGPALAYPTVLVSSPFTAEMFLGATGRGLLRLNSRSIWESTGLTSGTVYALAFDRASSGRMLAGMDAASGSLKVSLNNGQTWQNSISGLAGRTVYSLAQNHARPEVFLAGTDAGVYASTDGGVNWQPAGLDGQVVKSVATLDSQVGVLYLAGDNTGLYYTDQLPGSWNTLNLVFKNLGIQSMLRDAQSQVVLVATRFGGVLQLH